MPTATQTATQIRQQFVDFFVGKHGHTNVKSSPVVPHNDPTLLFANAGMNQFKPYFLGTETPPEEVGTRTANTQKCIRAGGKHNDLDDVGKDSYHHTFFEMLGNWSFGDYFKEEAIAWAWELLTEVWGVDPERLHASYFEGDASEGLEPDLEAKALWGKYLPEERIHPGNKKDNFWEMGDTGPCGPCSELHYDRSPRKDGGALVNADDQDTVVEIWNLVFIQYNRATDGKLSALPDQHVDTGMGFERIVRVLQGKTSNYDTDVFTPLFAAIQEITGARPYDGGDGTFSDAVDTAYRVIADHIRTLTFALTDGAHCGNKGRDAVLRTVLRRAVRFGHQTLGVEEPFFYKLVPALVDLMGDAFPEIKDSVKAVQDELLEEELAFRKTLERGIAIFEGIVRGDGSGTPWGTGTGWGNIEGLDDDNKPEIPGYDAFQMEATFGFPISLTQLMAEERGLKVDLVGYEQAKLEHAEISRAGGANDNTAARLIELVQQNDFPDTEFVGYGSTEFAGTTSVQGFDLGERFVLVTGKTPFYGESGGQVGDTGTIAWTGSSGGGSLTVQDTQKQGTVFFHIGTLEGDAISGEAELRMSVDPARRAKIQSNHTSTHLLNRALRDRVNPDAMQRGSLVDDQKLRFDFSNDSALSPDELADVERLVNDDIAKDLIVSTEFAPQEDALNINGLRAVFGEKYPPVVRVVSIGPKVEDLLADPTGESSGGGGWVDKSIEFCGGTHLEKTGDAEGFVILSQEAVSKGVRRLTGLTSHAAHKASAEADALIGRAQALASQDVPDTAGVEQLNKQIGETTLPVVKRQSLDALIAKIQDKQKAAKKAAGQQAAAGAVDVARKIAEEQSGSVIAAVVPGADGGAIRTAMDVVTKKHPEAAVFLVGTTEDKVAMMSVVPKALIAKGLKAGDWVKHVAPIVNGGGGGKPDKAQAGGKDPSKADEAVAAAQAFGDQAIS